MSETVVEKINHLLNEEKWTRATLNNYTIKNFQDLDSLFDEISESKNHKEIKEICEEHLDHSKNSIIALYLSGIISLSKQFIDDTHLIQLISIFADNHKWNIVEYLCNRILDFGENKTALRTLADCFNNENRDDEKYDIWERLIKIDYNEAEIVKKIADYKEAKGLTEEAIKYYKKALHRYINKKLFSNIREIWLKLVEYGREDNEFYFLISRKIAKNISGEKTVILLKDLYPTIKEREDWEASIDLLKTVLEFDPKDTWARDEIIDCYKNNYKGHSHLDDYIRMANLNQSWRNVIEAISDFEKHISFDKGNFVYHKTWGVGMIRDIKGANITIDFAKKRNHVMSLKMAINALSSLDKNHIWVLKSIVSKEKLKSKIKSDHSWALKVIIKSFDNKADFKKIKSELVPSVLTASEWTSWSSEARKILKTDPGFGNLPDKIDCFVVRDKPISYEEKTFNQFKAEKNFYDKITTLQEFLDNSDPDSDYFLEMFQYFANLLKSPAVNSQIISSYLLVGKLIKTYPFLNPGISFTFRELLSDADDITSLFMEIESADLKRDFLIAVKKEIENWPEIFLSLFSFYLNRFIIDDLLVNGYKEDVKSKIYEIIDHYRDNREVFFWIARNYAEIPGLEKLDINYEKILINLIHLLELTFRDINNKKDVSINRRLNRNIQNYLFKEDRLEDFMTKQNEETVVRVFTLLQDVKDIDPVVVLNLKQKLITVFPKLKLTDKIISPEIATASKNFFVTQKSFGEKQKELKYILEVEIPKNSKEIGKAIEMGDLKENAEYKAGKEKQEALNIAVGKLKDELDRARIFDPDTVDTGRIGFGTDVTLKNLLNEEEEEVYTLLGPWESDPSANIISYQSPFGSELNSHRIGESLSFKINEREYKYTILSISRTADI